MSETREKAAAMPNSEKLTKAQRRALEAAKQGPLTICARGWLAFDGVDGSRHAFASVHAAGQRKWLAQVDKGPFSHTKPTSYVLTDAGRAALAEDPLPETKGIAAA
ncbi:hypothetical protein [Antarcticirhabdus aurantiaca]|uniref:Uncharacterized protein n=1 Tax=Antarcticirhabdus aurantiaca TaxID=2606717 RepID=A0ACD4NL55_9HYPH|nr:hypothetical protein OXU80_22150 [Jeongeuplla avenae]